MDQFEKFIHKPDTVFCYVSIPPKGLPTKRCPILGAQHLHWNLASTSVSPCDIEVFSISQTCAAFDFTAQGGHPDCETHIAGDLVYPKSRHCLILVTRLVYRLPWWMDLKCLDLWCDPSQSRPRFWDERLCLEALKPSFSWYFQDLGP